MQAHFRGTNSLWWNRLVEQAGFNARLKTADMTECESGDLAWRAHESEVGEQLEGTGYGERAREISVRGYFPGSMPPPASPSGAAHGDC